MSNETENNNANAAKAAKADAANAEAAKGGSEPAKYTPLTFRSAVEVVDDAADSGFFNSDLAARVMEEAGVVRCTGCPGTWFANWIAKTWREAAAFSAAVVGSAFASGLYAKVSVGWEDGLAAKDGGRIIYVFIASADYMTDDGHEVVYAAESEEDAR